MSFDGFWVPEFVAGGLLKPLNQVAGTEVDQWEGWRHIPQNVQALLTYQGKVYGIPIGTDARAIWYRKDLLQQAGLPENRQPKSWNELLEAVRVIRRALPDVTPLQINAGPAMGEATTLQGWYMVVQGAGANVYNFETNKYIGRGQPILDALNFYKTVYIDEQLGDARLQLLQDGRQQSFLQFRDGKIAMLVEGDFFWRSVLAGGDTKLENRDQLVAFAKMPAKEPGQGIRNQDFVTASGGGGYVLNPNTQHPQEAWALLALMNSRGWGRRAGILPPPTTRPQPSDEGGGGAGGAGLPAASRRVGTPAQARGSHLRGSSGRQVVMQVLVGVVGPVLVDVRVRLARRRQFLGRVRMAGAEVMRVIMAEPTLRRRGVGRQ